MPRSSLIFLMHATCYKVLCTNPLGHKLFKMVLERFIAFKVNTVITLQPVLEKVHGTLLYSNHVGIFLVPSKKKSHSCKYKLY